MACRRCTNHAPALVLGTPTVEELAEGLDSSRTTVYEDVTQLVDSGLPERVTDTQPHRYSAGPVDLDVRTEDSYRITPALPVALARSETNETLELYRDRHGTAGLATALEYAREFVRGRMNARTMAREQELPVLEAETVLQELRAVLLEVEPEIAEDVDPDELDAAVEDRFGE